MFPAIIWLKTCSSSAVQFAGLRYVLLLASGRLQKFDEPPDFAVRVFFMLEYRGDVIVADAMPLGMSPQLLGRWTGEPALAIALVA